ncbi:MAG: hypothetical protein EZS28_037133 [Streblomastix strix]|uniref:C2 domain-containing protein n=1 Tax=Streblomastix strix TaxID=222440 RepID=A0A5J4UAV9_9EUKA|nr:MAG: hypothetical protein EZS28_037133 [Streblomastix strix]
MGISVHNLPKMDPVQKTDPFVVFEIGEKSEHTTIARQTINHEYKDEEYLIEYDPVQLDYQRKANVEVWDFGRLGMHELIGQANVDV